MLAGWGCRSPDPGVPPAGDVLGLCAALGLPWGLERRAEAPEPSVGAQQWVQGPTPSQQPFLSHQAGDKAWNLCATFAVARGNSRISRLLSECLTSQVPPPVSRWTWGLRPTDRQHCRGSLSTSWRTISRHREFQEGASLLRTKSKDNEGAANAVG